MGRGQRETLVGWTGVTLIRGESAIGTERDLTAPRVHPKPSSRPGS